MTGVRRPWTEANDAELLALVRAHCLIKEVAEKLRRSVPEVEFRLGELGAATKGAVSMNAPNKRVRRRAKEQARFR